MADKDSSPKQQTVDFGYREIPIDEKTQRVAEVFHSVATKYDLMNDLMSFGIHRLWKRFTVELASIRKGQKVLDLAGGTGDLTKRLLPLVGDKGLVVLADINNAMLNIGREHLVNSGHVGNVVYVQANAENLPFADEYFDCITIAFGLRNVTYKEKALAAMHRVLKPGGKLLILEFSHLTHVSLKPLYDLYSFTILPFLGKVIVDDSESYQYLAESIRRQPTQEQLKTMMEQVGFSKCDYQNLSAGIVAVHSGSK